MEEKNKSFEDFISELDSVVKKLESKDISLDEAVKSYTLGIQLSQKCYEILGKNEELVVKAMTESGLETFKKE